MTQNNKKYDKMFTVANSFQDWLVAELNKRDWSQSDLARAGGINRATISLILSEDRSPGPEVCTAIAKAFKYSPETIFRIAGLLPSEPEEDVAFEEWKYLLSQLPEKDREELLEIARLKLERREREEQQLAGSSRSTRSFRSKAEAEQYKAELENQDKEHRPAGAESTG